MTVNIEYEAEKQLEIPYEEIIRDVAEAALAYEGCPYEAEVNVVLTGDEEICQVNREYRPFPCWSTKRHRTLITWRTCTPTVSIRKPEN